MGDAKSSGRDLLLAFCGTWAAKNNRHRATVEKFKRAIRELWREPGKAPRPVSREQLFVVCKYASVSGVYPFLTNLKQLLKTFDETHPELEVRLFEDSAKGFWISTLGPRSERSVGDVPSFSERWFKERCPYALIAGEEGAAIARELDAIAREPDTLSSQEVATVLALRLHFGIGWAEFAEKAELGPEALAVAVEMVRNSEGYVRPALRALGVLSIVAKKSVGDVLEGAPRETRELVKDIALGGSFQKHLEELSRSSGSVAPRAAQVLEEFVETSLIDKLRGK